MHGLGTDGTAAFMLSVKLADFFCEFLSCFFYALHITFSCSFVQYNEFEAALPSHYQPTFLSIIRTKRIKSSVSGELPQKDE